jgi:hypothetical protein
VLVKGKQATLEESSSSVYDTGKIANLFNRSRAPRRR